VCPGAAAGVSEKEVVAVIVVGGVPAGMVEGVAPVHESYFSQRQVIK